MISKYRSKLRSELRQRGTDVYISTCFGIYLLNSQLPVSVFVVNNNTTKIATNIYIYIYIRERFFMGFFYNAIKDWKAFARDLGNVYLNKI